MHRTLLLALLVAGLAAQDDWHRHHIILPVSRILPTQPVAVERVEAAVSVREQLATTTLTVHLRNRNPQRMEAVLVLPLPAGAAVRSYAFEGPGGKLEARILPVDEARRTYQEIVRSMRDPALLEFVGSQLLRSSVFPVEPGATQAVRLSFEELLPVNGGRVDYLLPRGESLANTVPWSYRVNIEVRAGLANVYTPSHPLRETSRSAQGVSLVLDGSTEPGPLRLTWQPQGAGGATVFAVPEGDGGCFLFLTEAPALQEAKPIPRELTVVVDRSGSMAGDKWKQTQAAVSQVLAGLGANERFNLVLFNEAVDAFSPGPIPHTVANEDAARRWLLSARPSGGTNVHEALKQALAVPASPGHLPLVLLLTDGLPTIGTTSELAIRRLVENDAGQRRVFTLGIGADVNAPLLDAIALGSRARPRSLPPGGDVEVAVAEAFRALGAPVLAAPELKAAPGRLLDLQPRRLRDAFAGEQLVVLGRYAGQAPIDLELSGIAADGTRLLRRVRLDPAQASPADAWVARLWATRRIGELVQTIRDLGADGRQDDARLKELVQDVVSLSTRYGIMTEYTAFLATEGAGPPAAAPALREAFSRLKTDAMGSRSGEKGQIGSLNNDARQEQAQLNPRNRMLADGYRQREETAVQQSADSALYQRGNRWIEARSAGRDPQRIIAFGSADHFSLAERLARSNRQSLLAQDGEIQLLDGDEVVLVR